jgi:hypothetical protein
MAGSYCHFQLVSIKTDVSANIRTDQVAARSIRAWEPITGPTKTTWARPDRRSIAGLQLAGRHRHLTVHQYGAGVRAVREATRKTRIRVSSSAWPQCVRDFVAGVRRTKVHRGLHYEPSGTKWCARKAGKVLVRRDAPPRPAPVSSCRPSCRAPEYPRRAISRNPAFPGGCRIPFGR